MTKQEIIAALDAVGNQGNQLDLTGNLVDALKGLVDLVPDTPAQSVRLIVSGQEDNQELKSITIPEGGANTFTPITGESGFDELVGTMEEALIIDGEIGDTSTGKTIFTPVSTLDKTQIFDMLQNGKPVYLRFGYGGGMIHITTRVTTHYMDGEQLGLGARAILTFNASDPSNIVAVDVCYYG